MPQESSSAHMREVLAALRHGIATMADEVRLQELIERSMQELRRQYRRSSDGFSQDLISELQRAGKLRDVIHEFREAIEEAADARTSDEATDAASWLESLRGRLRTPLLSRRLDKELRELAERSAALPEAQRVRSSATRRRIKQQLESAAEPCRRCGHSTVLRETRDGFFWGCGSFPSCFSTRQLTQEEWRLLESAL